MREEIGQAKWKIELGHSSRSFRGLEGQAWVLVAGLKPGPRIVMIVEQKDGRDAPIAASVELWTKVESNDA